MSDDEKEPSATAVSRRLAPGGGGGGAWLGGPKTGSSEKFGNVKAPGAWGQEDYAGFDLQGNPLTNETSSKLRETFDYIPFSVLNARDGAWQARKRAWLACGIQSEVGRGENLLKMSDTLLEPDPEKRAEMQAARGLTWGVTDMDAMRHREGTKGDAQTFGSGGPGELSAEFKAKSLNTQDWVNKKIEEGEIDGGMSGNQTGTSIFDPVLTELCYRWFCPPGGQIVDPFAGGSVRGVVAGLLGFRYHGIDLRPEQIAANEAQRALICPEADIHWVVGDSYKELANAPDADFIFSCPPYGDLEQYSDDPKDLSSMTWEGFVGTYRGIIRKAVERLKPNRFACFVVGEYRDKETGLYRGFVPLTCASFMAAGAALYNEAILITAVGSLPIRVTKQFETSRKLGKALRNGTLVLSPNGWKPIEALKEGDDVIAVDGCPTKVTAVYPQGVRSLWEVKFTDGTSLVADSEHRWGIQSNSKYEVLTTAEIITRYGQQPKENPQVPSCEPVQFPAQSTPLDPYLVGLLLGDGGLNQNTPVLTSEDQELVESLVLPAGVSSRALPVRSGGSHSFILVGEGSRSLRNPLTAILRELGMMKKKAHQKFVPDLYLWNDIETRLATLQGLMDTDGGISGRSGTTEFSSISRQLADDVTFLARSLGAKVIVTPRKPTTYKYLGEVCYGQPSYRVRISGGPCPFRLKRKADVWNAANDTRVKSLRKSIKSIERAPDGLATCISIEHSMGLFVVENFTVTHNTHQNVIICCKGDPKLAAEAIRADRDASAPPSMPSRPAPAAPAEAPSSPEFGQSKAPSGGSLAEFLGTRPLAVPSDWRPDEPPDLTDINEIVLNFATDGLDWAKGARPVGVTVSTLDGQMTRFLPFRFADGNLDEETVKRWAKEQLRGKKITNSKTKFDIHQAREWGIDLEEQGCTFSDIQHTAALLDDHRKRFSLDILAADYFPGEPFEARVDESQHSNYRASDVAAREKNTAQLVGRLREVMYPELDKQELRAVQDLEDGVIPAVVTMEKNGSPIDMELLERYGRECSLAHDTLMKEISEECGFAFEHTASGWKRLIESLHLSVPDSFSEKVLNEVEHPLVRKGQRAAQYASLNSKIFKAYPEHIVDGILRYNINQLVSDEGGTVSGRFSIGLVQQVPNEDNHTAAFGDELFPRRLFIPGSGNYLEADAAQIEFRLLVHYSGNTKLLQAYKDDPWMSFHKTMQGMLTAYKPDMLYVHTKNYNFAAQYGARSIKLAVMMEFISAAEGDEIRAAKRWNDPRLNLIHEIEAAYKRAHPEAGELLDRASHLAKTKCDDFCKRGDALHRLFPHRGFVKTLTGRRSRFPTNYKTYIGLNRVLQGTGADIMKKKLTELHDARKETGFVMRITNHDAALGDALAPDTLEKVSAILNKQSFDLKVPIVWKCGVGANWADVK